MTFKIYSGNRKKGVIEFSDIEILQSSSVYGKFGELYDEILHSSFSTEVFFMVVFNG